MTTIPQMEVLATDFEEMCLVKIAIVRKLPNGKWVVKSRKGKILGTYDTKEQATHRLKQIEWFKYHKKASDNNYSATMRKIRKEYDEDMVNSFQEEFKKRFDEAYVDGSEHPEKEAFEKAIECLNGTKQAMMKQAADALNLGDPAFAGQRLAQLVKFLLSRVSPEKQSHAIDLMKRKIYYLNEYDIGKKKTRGGQMYGQSITILKTLLMGHSPVYIRNVLNAIVGNLR